MNNLSSDLFEALGFEEDLGSLDALAHPLFA